MSVPKPHWFRPGVVMVSTAPTCGISKSGGALPKFDEGGRRIQEPDSMTSEMVDAIDDCLLDDMEALRAGRSRDTLHFIDRSDVSLRHAVPAYYDRRYHRAFEEAMSQPEFEGFTTATLKDLVNNGRLELNNGHGSAPKDLRVGEVPYIKVSDLRAGLVNINPTNHVPFPLAERMWGGPTSGLQPFDLLCPERASKNIGDFCILMPGQEQILLTKEVIILRAGPAADFDQFYLLWAMTLKVVRDQWNRVIFMQTNREDVGKRHLEIEIPVAPNRERAHEVSQPFRRYFTTLAGEREHLRTYLDSNNAHHFFIAGAEEGTMDLEDNSVDEGSGE
jgi:hypothetical protein